MRESTSDAEYEVVSLGLSWGGVSIASFLLSLASPYLMRYVPWHPPRSWIMMMPVLWILPIIVLSFVGLLAGGVGIWRSRRKTVAKVGLALNGFVLGLLLLAVALIVLILRR